VTALVVVLALSLPVGIALGLLRGDHGRSAAPAHHARADVAPSTPVPGPTVPAQEGDPGFWPTGVGFWNARHGVIVGGLAKGLRGCRFCRGEIALAADGPGWVEGW
jgi:hypothetical protein